MTHDLLILRPHPELRVKCACRCFTFTCPALRGETEEQTMALTKLNHARHVAMYQPITNKEAHHAIE